MVVSFVCGLGVFGRIPITTTEATMPLSNCAKNIIRYLAFSMPDGHVYFQTKVLEEVARKQSERAGCMEIATMAQKDPTMRQVLLTIVQQLRGENDIIARGLIKDNFFGGYFTVTKKIGKSMKGYYTPFHAEAFGSIAEMERGKSEMLRNIQKVSPYLNDDSA
jgi:hypothetical protein